MIVVCLVAYSISKMTVEKIIVNSNNKLISKTTVEQRTALSMVETYFNTINHMFIGTVTIYITWLCVGMEWNAMTWHILLCTFGVSIFNNN